MEMSISDLLDDFLDDSPDITTQTVVDRQRIKKLTVMKIRRQENTGKRQRNRGLVRAVIIAAVLACLSFAVFAVAGDYFPQWLNAGADETIGYDNDLYIGSASKNWDIEGWRIELKAENVTPTGLTMVCTEWGGQEHRGVLTTDDYYWLEYWNGDGYAVYPSRKETTTGSSIAIQKNTTHSWLIDWEDCYGTLQPGHYRLGKTFTHTLDAGHSQTLKGYVKLRVLEKSDAVGYGQYETAINALLAQDTSHLTWQVFPDNAAEYTSYTMEIWRSGEDYLQKISYLNKEGTVLKCEGAAQQGGVGYRLSWNHTAATGNAMQREKDTSLNKNSFCLWHTFLQLSATGIDEMKQSDNTIVFIERADSPSEIDWETVATFDAAGQILSIKQYSVSEGVKTLYSVLTVHNTDPHKIMQTVADLSPE